MINPCFGPSFLKSLVSTSCSKADNGFMVRLSCNKMDCTVKVKPSIPLLKRASFGTPLSPSDFESVNLENTLVFHHSTILPQTTNELSRTWVMVRSPMGGGLRLVWVVRLNVKSFRQVCNISAIIIGYRV